MTELSAAILNGGIARRMHGRDKSRIPLKGKTVLQRQLEVLEQRCHAIAMVGGEPEQEALVVLADRRGGLGPVDGIASGLAWSPSPWLFVIAGDMPSPSLALLDAMLARAQDGTDVVGARQGQRPQPLFALYHRRILPCLDARLSAGQLRASALFDPAESGLRIELLSDRETREADPFLKSFQNLNDPDDVLTSQASIE